METIQPLIQALIDDMDWTPEDTTDENVVIVRVNGENGQWLWRGVWPEDETMFMNYSIMAFDVPDHRLFAVGEFINRANYGILVGNFEIDFSDGEIRYKTSVPLREENLTMEMLRDLVMINFVTFDKYLPGLLAVIYGNADPKIAIANIEDPEKAAQMDPYGRRAYIDDVENPSEN